VELAPIDIELRLDCSVKGSRGRRRLWLRVQPQEIERIVGFVRGHYASFVSSEKL
jgi:hypothetical protein